MYIFLCVGVVVNNVNKRQYKYLYAKRYICVSLCLGGCEL